MLLGLSLVRLSELKPARNPYRTVYSVKGPARVTHRLAVITCVALALIPLMQFNARLAQTISSVQYLPIAPYEIFSAPLPSLWRSLHSVAQAANLSWRLTVT